jgi:peptidyl-prolyl cis-trans isomerase C
MKTMHLLAAALATGILATLTLAAAEAAKPAVKAVDLFPDKVVARGRGFEIKSSEVDAELLAFKTDVAASGGSVDENRRVEYEKKILDRLIVTRILISNSTAADKASAEEKVDTFIRKSKEQIGSEEAYNRQIEARGHSPSEFRRKLLERGIAEEVYNRDIKSKIVVGDSDIRKFYEDNPDQFKQPEMVRAAHILKMTVEPKLIGVRGANPELSEDQRKIKRQEIEGVLKRARDGEDFAKLVKENTDDLTSKEKGGEYTFPRGQMASEFEVAAFSMGVNQISDVVTTKYGYHVIKVLEKLPPQKIPLEKASDKIKEFLIQRESDKLVPAYTEKAKKEAGVEILN